MMGEFKVKLVRVWPWWWVGTEATWNGKVVDSSQRRFWRKSSAKAFAQEISDKLGLLDGKSND